MITSEQIKRLRSEAWEAGDDVAAAWCDLALAYTEFADSTGDLLRDPVTGEETSRSTARAICAAMIDAAAAMDDDGGAR